MTKINFEAYFTEKTIAIMLTELLVGEMREQDPNLVLPPRSLIPQKFVSVP